MGFKGLLRVSFVEMFEVSYSKISLQFISSQFYVSEF